MNRFDLSRCLRLALAFALCLPPGGGFLSPLAQGAGKPNVVLLMVDDLDNVTWDAALKAGLLPNLKNHLIQKGVSFTQSFVTNAVCCPSRATMLSGQYTKNHGIKTVAGGILYWLYGEHKDGEKNTLATWLQGAGYRTTHIGKYLNGYGYYTKPEYRPPGYDEWYALIDPSTYSVYDFDVNVNGTPVHYSKTSPRPELTPDGDNYQTDVLANFATDFIVRHRRDHSTKPFFMILTPSAPHIEVDNETLFGMGQELGYLSHFYETIRPAKRHLPLVDGNLSNGEVPSLVKKASYNHNDPEKIKFVRELPFLTAAEDTAVNQQYKERMASMIAVDEMVGKVLGSLDSVAQDNTVFIFTSDNGYFFGEHKLSSKLFAYEESIRVPLVIRGPGFAKNVVSPKLVINTDLASTVVQVSGATAGRVQDGRSLVPLLQNPAANWTRKQFLVEHYLEGGGLLPTVGGLTDLSPPTYRAIRRRAGSDDKVFVQWHEINVAPNRITFEEFYRLNDPAQPNAPLQMNNQKSGLSSGERSTLASDLEALKACAGSTCRAVEDK